MNWWAEKKHLLLASVLLISIDYSIAQVVTTTPEFITETKEDIDVALNNPILQQGKAIPTLAGTQLMDGSLPRDFRINQQIYDDITKIQSQMIALMKAVLYLGNRYDKASEFMLIKVQLETLLAQLENALKTKLVK